MTSVLPDSGEQQLKWSLWQLLDSVFPTGGFAHSSGLEAAVQIGSVADSITLQHFVLSCIQNTAALLLPFVFEASQCSSIDLWKRLDSFLHAQLTNHVARRASITQGTALLRVASSVFVEIPQLKEMRAYALKLDQTQVHHAPLFGFLCGLLGIDAMTAQRAFLFVTLRDLFSAATRLNVVGPLEAAQMQHRIATEAEAILSKYANRPIRDAHQTAPVMDVIQGFHDHLYSRLFRS